MKSFGTYCLLTLAASLLALVAGCATTGGGGGGGELIEANDPIRFHVYEDYYTRGRSRMIAGMLPAASEDFQVCLGLARGARRFNNVDDWRVRTHGEHVFSEYFPNRELGICYHLQGDNVNALKFLNISMAQAPSSRAKYFLNKIAAEELANQNVAVPVVTLAVAEPVIYTRDLNYALSGSVRAAGKVEAITINREPDFVELAETQVKFARTLSLEPGLNTVEIAATDLSGQSVTNQVKIVADLIGPQIIIQAKVPQAGGALVKVLGSDNRGLAEIYSGGGLVPMARGTDAKAFEVFVPEGERIAVTATDVAGNTSELVLTGVKPSLQKPTAPVVQLKNEHAVYRVHNEQFFVDGTVESEQGIQAILLNGSNVLQPEARGGKTATFTAWPSLKEGRNEFVLEVQSVGGTSTVKKWQVIRTPPEYVREEFKLAVSVPPMYARRGQAEGYTYQKALVDGLLRPEKRRFNLLTRNAQDLELIKQEVALNLSKLVDPKARIDFSKFNDAELSFNGVLIHHREGYEIRVQVVDTATQKREMYADIYVDHTEANKQRLIQALISKIERNYPVLQARVTDVDGSRVTVDAGAAAGLREGGRFLVIAPGEDGSMENGSLRKAAEQLLELRTERLEQNQASASSPGGAGVVKPGDFIYAR